MAPSPPDLVLLDAFGTLVAMDPPGPILHAELAAAGYDIDPHVVDEALRAEVAHYRARMHIAGDPAGLRALRAECGAVLAHALGPGAPPAPRATELLVASLRFRLHHDALGAMDALDAQGIRFGVVSNWDCALPDHLAALGVDDRFAVIAVSASVGAAKPDPAIFLHATEAAGVEASRALHVGDRLAEDYEGARGAGLRALLLDRTGDAAGRGTTGPEVITTLTEIPGIIAR
ncbi:MAG: HAD-IA family hydrolase [Actinobacteria bacterium]|nr:HAD-IA family hydrolase [Actinomycetota bacterium]MBM3697546.1 HAD-IA family hydrolase [Actinomycetota bacterium]